ncbi:Secreted protein [Neolecta irregularis DAH-3]|uniref:Secreted protein n=1 Tax=Neolecta irregularis (strain DAH-3) TaxID=1198029 RepID=A0A1U7LSI5_NEOID|nr:Secreted protein [Neolecta irregularis DAH-3]|eukprot:OLL25589.1 Secreted protein [Neolecta irregularis DAH-3]
MRLYFLSFLAYLTVALDCVNRDTLGPQKRYLFKRKQPEAPNAEEVKLKALDWGQLNFLHTTDTHGWLEGHLKEKHYGGDWGDFSSFVTIMKEIAAFKQADLLLIDTGDLNDGNGMSDATAVSGERIRPLYTARPCQTKLANLKELPFDILTIGNHELYRPEIALDVYQNFAPFWGDRYLTSNVQIYDPNTGELNYIGKQYRHFQTKMGLNIMAFGFLFDFDRGANNTVVIKMEDSVKEQWFLDALAEGNVDLFLLAGHIPVRGSSEWTSAITAIRAVYPNTPIQIFGGHYHIRDFVAYDSRAVGLASGRYCETVGWISINGLNNTLSSDSGTGRPALNESTDDLRISRKYLDFNRFTFAFHTNLDQFDTRHGKKISHEITQIRHELNLTSIFGCAPQDYYLSRVAYEDKGSLIRLISQEAIPSVVVREARRNNPRIFLMNSGLLRFDIFKGLFTHDDSFIVAPFKNSFQFIPSVPYTIAKGVLSALNAGKVAKRREPEIGSLGNHGNHRPISQLYDISPGYVTYDDFGTDGDDTKHPELPNYHVPNYLQGNASFSVSEEPDSVDVIFIDFIARYVLDALKRSGKEYSLGDIQDYLPEEFYSRNVLPKYAQENWPC